MKMIGKPLMISIALLLVAMLALAGCSSGVSQDDFDDLEAKVNALQGVQGDVDAAQAAADAAQAAADAAQGDADAAMAAADAAQDDADAAMAAADAAQDDADAAMDDIDDLKDDVETLMEGNYTPPPAGNDTPSTCEPSESVCNIMGAGAAIEFAVQPPLGFDKLAALNDGMTESGSAELIEIWQNKVYTKIPNIPATFGETGKMAAWMIAQGAAEADCFGADVRPLLDLEPAIAEFALTDFTAEFGPYEDLSDAVDDIGHDGLSAQMDQVMAFVADDDIDAARDRTVEMFGWMMVQLHADACG